MTKLRSYLAASISFAVLLPSTVPSSAQASSGPLFSGGIGPSTGQGVGAIVGIAGVGAAIGIGVYYAVHHGRSLTGCAASAAGEVQLHNDADHQTYVLIGETTALKSGNRLRVSGKKNKNNSAASCSFLVEKVSKDYGPREIPSAVR
jgi:hypothetical protein